LDQRVPNTEDAPKAAQPSSPQSGAGSMQMTGPNSEDQGDTGIKGSAQSEGATNKDTTPR